MTERYDCGVNAISILRRSGLTTAQIAHETKRTEHAIRYWERGDRFPDRDSYRALCDLAAKRGLHLVATDFIVANDEES